MAKYRENLKWVSQWRSQEKGIRYAMRITLSPDGNKIFVAACSDGPNLSYNREPFSAMGKIKCNTLLDNLELDTEGTL